MRENKIRTIWKQGGAVINGWLSIPNTWSAEVMAHQGWDSLLVDMQHGLMDLGQAIAMFQAISTTDTVPLARANWNEPGGIMKLLDAGAYGIVCPMVNTRQECEAFVGACRYHPQGYRSLGPTRARVYAGADYPQHANDTVLAIAMIETAQAMQNLDAIVSVPGLDAVYVGPGDLGLSVLGKPSPNSTDPAFMELLERILSSAKGAGIVAGIHTSSVPYAKLMIEMGMQFVTVGSDTSLMADAARAVVAGMRDESVKPEARSDPY